MKQKYSIFGIIIGVVILWAILMGAILLFLGAASNLP